MVHCLVAYFCLFNTLSATHFDLILEMYIEMLHMIMICVLELEVV